MRMAEWSSRPAGTGRPPLRLTVGLLVALLVAAACSEQSRVDPGATVQLSGQLLDVDGSPLSDRPVELGSGVTDLEGGAGAFTVGLFCLGGDCTGDTFSATTDEDGSFTLELSGRETQSAFGEATSFLLSASDAPSGTAASGPAVAARFRIQATDVVLPSLRLVDPALVLEAVAGAVSATWDGAAAPGPYDITFVDAASHVVWQQTLAQPSAQLDGRILEDAAGLASVSGSTTDQIEGSEVAIRWRSSALGFRGGFGAPPSRGSSCQLVAADGTVQRLDDCGLTDGSFGPASVPAFVCAAQADAASTDPCPPVQLVRVLLPSAVPADLLVVRGCAAACRGRVVPDGSAVPVDVGPVGAAFGAVTLDGSPVTAVDIVVDAVPALAEVSVWSSVAAPTALLPVEPGSPGGTSTGGRAGGLLIAAAVGAALASALALGAMVGVRARSRGS